MAALQFASDTLRPGGHFVCKFYQGLDDKKLEAKLKAMFGRVARDKPEASRSVSHGHEPRAAQWGSGIVFCWYTD